MDPITAMRRLPILIIAGFVLELTSLIWVGGRLGVIPTLLLIAGGFIAGTAVIRWSGLSMTSAVRQTASGRQFTSVDASVAILRMTAGLLLIVPGFFSDLMAILLLLPGIGRRIASRFMPQADWQFQSRGYSSYSGGVVIDGEASEIAAELPPSRPAPGRDE